MGQWQVAVRALRQVLALSQGQRLHLGILAEIVGEVERGRGVAPPALLPARDAAAPAPADSAAGGAVAGSAAAAAEGAVPPAAAAEAQQAQQAQQGEGTEEAEDGAGMAALAAALASMGSSPAGSAGAAGTAEHDAAAAALGCRADPATLAAAEEHGRQALERMLGMLLKEGASSTASSTAGDSAFWELYGRWVQPKAWEVVRGWRVTSLCAPGMGVVDS